MSVKSVIKKALLNFRLRGVNHINLDPFTHIGKYTLITTDPSSSITFNRFVTINDYIKLLADDRGKIVLGEHVYIGDYSTLRATRADIVVGANTMIAQGVRLISTNHYYKAKDKLIRDQDIDAVKIGIKIGEDCWLGAGCVVLPGVSVGNGVVIGANAVVTKDLPDYAVAVGSPAKVISYRS